MVPRAFEFPSSSGSGTYTAHLNVDGKLTCNCKGWTMRRGTAPRHCKHTKEIAANAAGVDVRGEFVYIQSIATLAAPVRPAATSTRVIAPMLASAMTVKLSGKAFDRQYANADWAMERKHDGWRCVATVDDDGAVDARTREGNVIDLPAHIIAALTRFPAGVYDGELVAASGIASDVVSKADVFVIFDVLESRGRDLTRGTYAERRRFLLDILAASLTPNQRAISTVESLTPSWAAIADIWKQGGEGVVLKRIRSTYNRGQRSPDWIKVKEEKHKVVVLVGFGPGKSGPCSVMKLRDNHGVEITCKVLGNSLLAQVTAAPEAFIDRRVVITYQQQLVSGKYRGAQFDHFAGEGE